MPEALSVGFGSQCPVTAGHHADDLSLPALVFYFYFSRWCCGGIFTSISSCLSIPMLDTFIKYSFVDQN